MQNEPNAPEAVEREVLRMRRAADDWRRPALRQVEGPNDLKIYGGTIADDIDRWADMIASLAKQSIGPGDGGRALECAAGALLTEARRLAGAKEGSDDCPHDYDQSALNWVRNRRHELARAALTFASEQPAPLDRETVAKVLEPELFCGDPVREHQAASPRNVDWAKRRVYAKADAILALSPSTNPVRDNPTGAINAQVERDRGYKEGIEAVAAERKRQIEVEGWTPEHDDEHGDGSLAAAAAAYAFAAATEEHYFAADPLGFWPWDVSWWKPKDARSNLVRAGALIVAEIERLDRRALLTPTPDSGEG